MGLEDDIRKLSRIPAFAGIEPEALRLIAFSAETRILRAGDVLFRRDEISNDGFVVLAGSIAMDASGDGVVTARIVRPPALIGDLALLTQTRRSATAIAREPSTVLRISRLLFRRVLHEFPDSAERLRQSLAARTPSIHRRTCLRAPRKTYPRERRKSRMTRCVRLSAPVPDARHPSPVDLVEVASGAISHFACPRRACAAGLRGGLKWRPNF